MTTRAPAWLVPSSFALAATEAISIVLQAGLLAWILSSVILGEAADLRSLAIPLAGLLAAWLLRALIVSLRSHLSARASSSTRQALRHELFQRLVDAGPLYRGRHGSGRLMTGLIEQVDLLDPYYARYLPQTTVALLVPGAILLAVMATDWLAGSLLLLAAPLIPGFMIIIGIGAAQVSRQQQDALGRLSGLFFDRLQGLDTIKRFGAEIREANRLAEFSEQFRVRTMQVLRIAFLSSAVLEFFSAVAIATLAIYIGLGLLDMIDFGAATSLTLFKGLFILLLAPEFFTPLRTLAQHWHDRAGALAAAGALRELLAAPVGRAEPAQPSPNLPTAPCSIRLKALGHGFPERPEVLRGIDLSVEPGEKLLISGSSGGGKSTLLGLLAGFAEPAQGQILVDGIDLTQFSRSQLASLRAYLGQQTFLLPASIADNIRFGAEDSDDRAVEHAADLAGVSQFARQLQAGLDTPLGQDGLGVSGGQARRIALARALLQPRPLLLLDEPTASLDEDTEQAFWVALSRALAETPMTVICTSHSRHALAWADRHLEMRQGQLHEVAHA